MSLIKMCDAALENSIDSLTARISKLEAVIASGNISLNAAPKTPVVEENKKEVSSPEEPKTVKVDGTVSNTDAISAPATANSLKVLRGWNEIIEKMPPAEIAAQGFLRKAKAFSSTDGSIHVRFENSFAKGMCEKPKTREALRAAICVVLNKTVNDDGIVFGILEGNEDTISELDEFNIE
jgi:hypothetical protein